MGHKVAEWLSALKRSSVEVRPDILFMNFTIVNACLVGNPGEAAGHWVLVDTGLENSADFILEEAEKRFGKDSRPEAIILTHGHFDHIGSVIELSERWDVPVYIHELELPYVTGKKDYPVADPSVDKGMVAKLSPTFPHNSIDLGARANVLPSDGRVPGMPGWRWLHTPGHTVGHTVLFREKDRVLIAADAVSTTRQESLSSVMSHRKEISGPPKYLTEDWEAAEDSVRKLMLMDPSLVLPGHGEPMEGEELTRHMEMLVKHFDEIAKPD